MRQSQETSARRQLDYAVMSDLPLRSLGPPKLDSDPGHKVAASLKQARSRCPLKTSLQN